MTNENYEPLLIAFCCQYCSYSAADLAGSMRLQYPTNVRIVRTPCTGRLEVEFFLRAFEKGTYGGWGGRSIENKDDRDLFSMSLGQNAEEMAAVMGAQNTAPVERAYPNFFPQAQRDFANRMKWAVTSRYADANHEPTVGIQVPSIIAASPGQKVPLYASVSDPDGNRVAVQWLQLEVGAYPGKVEIVEPNALHADVLVPKDAKAGQTIHLILEATDDGTPALTRYQRVVIVVKK